MQQISYKAATVNLLKKSHCLEKIMLKGPAVFLEEMERGAIEGGTVPFYTL